MTIRWCYRGAWSSQSDWCFCCTPGRMLLNDSKKGPAHLHYRRPYGCAVLSILDVLQSLTELKEEKDFVLKVYTWVMDLRNINDLQHKTSQHCPWEQKFSSFAGHRLIRLCRIGNFLKMQRFPSQGLGWAQATVFLISFPGDSEAAELGMFYSKVKVWWYTIPLLSRTSQPYYVFTGKLII